LIRERWAVAEDQDAELELTGNGAGVDLKVKNKADWALASRKFDDFLLALKNDENEICLSRLSKHSLTRVFAAFSNSKAKVTTAPFFFGKWPL
jgi:hypothetical protein